LNFSNLEIGICHLFAFLDDSSTGVDDGLGGSSKFFMIANTVYSQKGTGF